MAPKRKMTETNPSFVLEGPQKVKFQDRPVPEITSPHDVIVEVKFTGICGSDIHYWQHGSLGSYKLTSPMVLGHESAGIVHSIGSGVTDVSPGDLVAMEPGIACGRCARCTQGAYNLCPDMSFAATPPIDGTLARYWKLPAHFCYKLPEGVGLEEGALMEPLAVGVHIARQAQITPGESVVVWGAGPVGLLTCAVAKAFGATTVICADVNEERLNFAKDYAATGIFIPAKGESPQEIGERLVKEHGLEDEGGADIVVDATGAEPCIRASMFAVKMGGRYVQGGMGKSEITFPIGAFGAKEVTMKGCFRYKGGDYDLAIKLVKSGKVDVKSLISGRVDFLDAEKAFMAVKEGKGIKTLIQGPA